MISLTSTINEAQTLDSVSLPAFATQKRASATSAIIAAAAARTCYYSELKGDTSLNQTEYEYTPASGNTIALPDDTQRVRLKHGGTIAALTINPPASPRDGQRMNVFSLSAVTALTLTGLNSQTISGGPTALTAGGFFSLEYEKAANTWYRVG